MDYLFQIKTRKHFYFLTLLFLGIFALYLSPAYAMIVPQVYFTDLVLNKTNFEPGNTITGTVSLWNYEQFVISDLVFNFQLLGNEVDGVSTETINSQMDSNVFQLSPNEKTNKSFSYTLPANLPNDSLVFRIQLSNSRGEEMSWEDRVIIIGGENKFLVLENYWLIKDEVKLHPGGGVNYQVNDIPQIVFDVNNDSDFTITAFPKIITYKRSQGQFLQEDKKESIILKPGQEQTIETALPQLINSESYLSEVRLYNTETQEEISNSIYFRWIISGQDDAEILFVNPDKDFYEAGEQAEIDIQLTGPAHTYLEGTSLIPAEKGTLEINMFNKDNELVCQNSKEIDLEVSQVLMDCLIEKDALDPRIEIKITKNDKVLDKYEFNVESKGVTLEEPLEEAGFFEKNKKILLFIFIGLILIMTIILYFKNKKGSLTALFILFFIGALFSSSSVFAAIEVTGGLCDTTIAFNKPVPNGTYNDGDIINFSGKFRVTSCGDGLFFNKITFFITEDKEIPLTTVNACDGCLGATSSNYPQSACNCRWCNQVQILEEDDPDFKTYKLGIIYPDDVASGAVPYWVEYNQNFVIPDDLEFSGDVRFYVQYSGTHWNNHWHWNITYQPGFVNLNNSPTVSGLYDSDIDYCSQSPMNIILSWQFNDSDLGDEQSAYQVKITKKDTGQMYDSGKVSSPSFSITVQKINNDMDSNFIWYDVSNKGYSWEVKAWDLDDEDSNWANDSFKTAIHQWPTVDFDWAPANPSKDENAQFTDQSVVYGGTSISSWLWEFQSGNPASSSIQNPIIKFTSDGSKEITLQVTDSDGYTCPRTKYIGVNIKLPEWKEVLPW